MSTFTIPFPEYDIANYLQEKFPKKLNFSVNIPLSRQQKHYDLVLMNGIHKRVIVIQVKSSRTWKTSTKIAEKSHEYESFFNKFDIEGNYSDYYFIYMTYPVMNKNFSPGAKWDRKILVFSDLEMLDILSNIKTKKGTPENRFCFCFNSSNNVVEGSRGFTDSKGEFLSCFKYFKTNDFSKKLIENKLGEIEKKLN